MMRGTFANIRIKNQMVPGTEGGITRHWPDGEVMPIYDAAMKYKAEGKELVIFAGEQYGTGSSRDWAAKGTNLLGVRAVLADSFERIHRSNLIGMGVLPLQMPEGSGWKDLGMTGDEIVTIENVADLSPRQDIDVKIEFANGDVKLVRALLRIDTENELEYFRDGGILHFVLRNLARSAA
jgi:aconitate hydratase